jgi:hypothetical protein
MQYRILFCLITVLKTIHACGQESLAPEPPRFTIKPAIGLLPASIPLKATGSVLVTYPLARGWRLASHTASSSVINKNSYEVRTDYSLQFSQKFGGGYSFTNGKKWVRLTLLLMGGVKHITFKETLSAPGLERITTRSSTTMPDVGLLCDWALGRKRHTIDARLYLPFYPFSGYPISTYRSIGVEVGLGLPLGR